jgi:pyridinium-3,5-bisthiocarboxylic acid mononucleotide nickel chelatase
MPGMIARPTLQLRNIMRIAYLDCTSGISGDMTLGALVDAGVPLEKLDEAIGSLGLPGCRLVANEVKRHGFRAVAVTVEYQPEHAHRHLHHILAMIDAGRLTPRQKEIAGKIFTRLAEAEAKVHGTSIEKVHFHEVGAADSIADVVGTAVGWDLLGAERLAASPVPTGTGRIKIAHGEFNVPAPATAELLSGIPLAPSAVAAELTTPTGAAILATLAESFGPMPPMKIEQVGYGAGQRDLAEQANVLRLFVGEAAASAAEAGRDQVCVLETNLDDISGELVGYCTARLWEAGALDVFTTAIQMKKNRPGVKISVLCRPADAESLEAVLFGETTTLGVRRWTADRRILARQAHAVETSWGRVEGKLGWSGGGAARFAPEFESCRRIAAERGVPLREVYEAAQRAFEAEQSGEKGSRPDAETE